VLTALFLSATLALVALALELGLPAACASWRCSANAAALTAGVRLFDRDGRVRDEQPRSARDIAPANGQIILVRHRTRSTIFLPRAAHQRQFDRELGAAK
jgi:hypothetical protein